MKSNLLTRNTSLSLIALFTSSLLLAGCGGPPRNNPLVDESRAAYAAAALDPDVVSKAPDVLQQAEADLRRSEQLLNDGADPEEVEHYAYLAKQRVAIARETTRLKSAEASIEQAEVERKEVQLQARTAEAERARDEANASRLEAEASRDLAEAKADEAQLAREQTEQALAHARDLADRIAELEAEQTARGLVLTLSDVLFDVGKADLKPGAQRAIDELSKFLNEYAERNVLIEGFTDNTGSNQYNQDLSSHRSASVKSALIARGISDVRIQTLGYGESFPRASNGTAAGRQQNRRVEVIISDNSGTIPTRTN